MSCNQVNYRQDGSHLTLHKYPLTFDGLDYPSIVAALENQLGGVPEYGNCTVFQSSMACYLRYVCNNDPDWIDKIMPSYGETAEKRKSNINTACHRPLSMTVPAIVTRALEDARRIKNAEVMDDSTLVFGEMPPAMPEKLPRMIELLTRNVPEIYKPAVATAVFPSLGAHLHNVKFKYVDGVEHEPTFMCVLMAPQSIGKGCVNKPIEYIMEDIAARDKESRQTECTFKEQCRTKGANKDKPKRPEDICVQTLMANITNAALVQRAMDAERNGNKFLYTKMDEIELLNQIQTTGGATPSELIRLAFDCAEYGQERVGNESITGTPHLRWNWNASTTIETGQRFFAKGLLNGTLSRINFCTIIKPLDRSIPRFKPYTEEFRMQLLPYILLLKAASGNISCKNAEILAEKLLEENAETVALCDDEVLETLSFRSNVIAYLKAMVLYICNGYEWSKEIEDFVRWSEQYDLWCKMKYFYDQYQDILQKYRTKPKKGPRNLLDVLPQEFTKEDLVVVRLAQGLSDQTTTQINNWTKRGYVKRVGKSYQKIIKNE